MSHSTVEYLVGQEPRSIKKGDNIPKDPVIALKTRAVQEAIEEYLSKKKL
jgi:hypothetical protein